MALVALVGGTLAWLAPLRTTVADGPAWHRERRAWRAVIAPLLVVAFGTALLVGWAFEEPAQSDERLAPIAWVLVAAVLFVWLRALIRLARSALARPSEPLSVVGLFRPRVILDPRFEVTIDPASLVAALTHEAAHMRHRDPLRIALGQLATDLQWPWPRAKRRFSAWLALLEDCRDDEAVTEGVLPEDLAHAIVAAAGLATSGAGASLTGGEALAGRVARLLDEQPRTRALPSRWFAIAFVVGLVAALIIGLQAGDDLVGLLPGVLR